MADTETQFFTLNDGPIRLREGGELPAATLAYETWGTLNADGSKARRWVGPQDIKPGCIARPVFRIQKVYVVSGFGAHLVAEAIVIKPAPPKEVAEFDNVRVVEEPDPVMAARASAVVDSQGEVPEDAAPPDTHEEDGEFPAPDMLAVPDAAEEVRSPSTSGKKRKAAEDDGAKDKRKKKVQAALAADE